MLKWTQIITPILWQVPLVIYKPCSLLDLHMQFCTSCATSVQRTKRSCRARRRPHWRKRMGSVYCAPSALWKLVGLLTMWKLLAN